MVDLSSLSNDELKERILQIRKERRFSSPRNDIATINKNRKIKSLLSSKKPNKPKKPKIDPSKISKNEAQLLLDLLQADKNL